MRASVDAAPCGLDDMLAEIESGAAERDGEATPSFPDGPIGLLERAGLLALTRVSRIGELTSASEADPFGHSRPREIGESGSPSICDHLLILDVHLLAAPDRAIRAYGLDDPVCGLRAWHEPLRAHGLSGTAQAEVVTRELTQERRDQAATGHPRVRYPMDCRKNVPRQGASHGKHPDWPARARVAAFKWRRWCVSA